MAGKTKADEKPGPVKTSVKFERELWKRAHVRAMDDGIDLQDLIARALEAYLMKSGSR